MFLLIFGLIIGVSIGLVVLLSFDNHFLEDVFGIGVGIKENQSQAPDFELASLEDEQFVLSENLGKPIVLNFWATWCSPCRFEMPLFERYSKRYNGKLLIVGVNLQQQASEVHTFANELGLSFPIVLDSEGAVNKLYRVQGLPTTYFINSDGLISDVHIGTLSETQLDEYLLRMGISDD